MRILLILIFASFTAAAQVRPFQTTRLVATGGTGVGSLLVNEAAILNPASLAFFGENFASYQKTLGSLKDKNSERGPDNRSAHGQASQEGYFIFDNTEQIKGGFSYQRQRQAGFTRERMVLSSSIKLDDNIALGVNVNHTEDLRPNWFSRSRYKTTNPFVAGLTYVATEELTFGVVWQDPGRAIKSESRAVAGAQYAVTPSLILMADFGGDTTSDTMKKDLWRGAFQYRLLEDFYLRAGKFEDKTINERGLGYGIGWTGPKLGADLAMKQSEQCSSTKSYLYPREKLTEISFALNMRF